MQIISHPGFVRRLNREFVLLRRFARALTGSQTKGDALTDIVIANFSRDTHPAAIKLTLFKALYRLLFSGNGTMPPTGMASDVLLLKCLESFDYTDIASIIRQPVEQVTALYEAALAELKAMRPSRVMLIEDEFLIAMQMTNAISEFGHSVVGVARTRAEAIVTAKDCKPDLIISDIELADGSSGIDAIQSISEIIPNISVVYLTGYPEKLMTGIHKEPAFVLNKPYHEAQLLSAVSQALKLKSETRSLSALR